MSKRMATSKSKNSRPTASSSLSGQQETFSPLEPPNEDKNQSKGTWEKKTQTVDAVRNIIDSSSSLECSGGSSEEESSLQRDCIHSFQESVQKIRDVWIDNFFVELQRITSCISDKYNYVAMVSRHEMRQLVGQIGASNMNSNSQK